MQQILNITEARKNLSQLVAEVAREDKNIVILRDSKPEAVLMPYARVLKEKQLLDRSWTLRFERLLKEGKKIGKRWAKKRGIDLTKIKEEELYDLIKAI